jgi:hypothetical protein
MKPKKACAVLGAIQKIRVKIGGRGVSNLTQKGFRRDLYLSIGFRKEKKLEKLCRQVLKPIQASLVLIVDIDCFLSTQSMKTIFKAKILLYQEQRKKRRENTN